MGPLAQQPGETDRTYTRRWLQMSGPDRERVSAAHPHQDCRRAVNLAVKSLRLGEVPPHWRVHSERVRAVLAPIQGRYEAAQAVAVETKRQEIAATPIDDAAWEAELRRRADIDAHGATRSRRLPAP
jgi:hypothetical protein